MEQIRRWIHNKILSGQPSLSRTCYQNNLLLQLYYADDELNLIAAELDSFDGRKDPERCTALVNQLRVAQDKVITLIFNLMDEWKCERADRSYRVKFPDDLLSGEGAESLNGQIWFGAECLAAGSNIMNRERQSDELRPMARTLTNTLDQLRLDLRAFCNEYEEREISMFEMICKLETFDRQFASFEYDYVKAMLPIKTVEDIDRLNDVTVLFSECLASALKRGLISQDDIDEFQPSVMITLPRLSIVYGLGRLDESPIYKRKKSRMCALFKDFHEQLGSIRREIRKLKGHELEALERRLVDLNAAFTSPVHLPKPPALCLKSPATDNYAGEGPSTLTVPYNPYDLTQSLTLNCKLSAEPSITTTTTENDHPLDNSSPKEEHSEDFHLDHRLIHAGHISSQSHDDEIQSALQSHVKDIAIQSSNSNFVISSSRHQRSNSVPFARVGPTPLTSSLVGEESSLTRPASSASLPRNPSSALMAHKTDTFESDRSMSTHERVKSESSYRMKAHCSHASPSSRMTRTASVDEPTGCEKEEPLSLSPSVMRKDICNEPTPLTPQDSYEVTLALNAKDVSCVIPEPTIQVLHKLFKYICEIADQLQSNYASDLRSILKHVFAIHATREDPPSDEVSVEEAIEAQEGTLFLSMAQNEGESELQGLESHMPTDEAFPSSIDHIEANRDMPRGDDSPSHLSLPSLNGPDDQYYEENSSPSRPHPPLIDDDEYSGESGNSNTTGTMLTLDDLIRMRPRWVADSEAQWCSLCLTQFTLIRRRHHCRNCGNIYCGKCANQFIKLEHLAYLEPVRVCNRCIQQPLPYRVLSITQSTASS